MTIKTLKQAGRLRGRTVFLRTDFNVPMKGGKIIEDYRIRAGLVTIERLIDAGARVIVASHLGEPAGKDKEHSLRPVAARLAKLLDRPVKFVPDIIGPAAVLAALALKDGEIMMLENLRFDEGEYDNNSVFASKLAALADIYVNDAFAVCHREQASIAAIKKFLPSYAGLSLALEARVLDKMKYSKRSVVIMGGAKISTKAPLLAHFHATALHLLLGGALANNFFKFQGKEIGRSLFDQESAAAVKKFFRGRKLSPKIILPIDLVVKTKRGEARAVSPDGVGKNDTILDIGPKTIALYDSYIRRARTIIWNGPMGKFEEKPYRHGTLFIARSIASRSSGRTYGVVGGGETVEALRLTKMAEYVDWVSAAGGAMLAYLGGAPMPGLAKIVTK